MGADCGVKNNSLSLPLTFTWRPLSKTNIPSTNLHTTQSSMKDNRTLQRKKNKKTEGTKKRAMPVSIYYTHYQNINKASSKRSSK